MQHNTLVDRQTLYNLSSRVNDGNLGVQLSTIKVYGMMSSGDPAPPELLSELAASIHTLRVATNALDMFVFTIRAK